MFSIQHEIQEGTAGIVCPYPYSNRTDAEDLVQETCVRAIRAVGRLRPDSNVKAWLFTILRNIWLSELRQRRNAPEFVDAELDERTFQCSRWKRERSSRCLCGKLERRHVREPIQQLPPEAREVILLREWEELSYQEIATVLDCPVGTVMSRLARARAKLRELLCSLFQNSYPCGERSEATK